MPKGSGPEYIIKSIETPQQELRSATQSPGVPITITAEHTLELVTAAHKAKPDDPELLADFNQFFWSAGRQAMGLAQRDLVVSAAPYTSDQIRKFMGLAIPNFALYVPQILSTAEALILLGKRWPKMENPVFQQGNTVKNEDKDGNPVNPYDWMTTEKTIDAPYLNTTQAQAEQRISVAGGIGDTLNIYAIAGQQSRLLEGRYFDQSRTYARILLSRNNGQGLHALFDPDGDCGVGWSVKPDAVFSDLGARSAVGAKV